MTTKIEIIGDSLTGPWTIKLNDTVITDVEEYELYNDGRVNRLKLVLITDNLTLKTTKKCKC
jgi:hypothetical protein